MPELTPLGLFLWSLVIVGQPALVTMLLSRGLWRRWRALCTYLAFLSLKSITLAILFGRQAYAGYFYVYWIGAGCAALLQLLVLREVVTALLGRTGHRLQGRIFLALTVVSLVVSVVVTLHASPSNLKGQMHAIDALDRVLSLAWCILFLLVTVSTESIGVIWHQQPWRVAMGFACQAAGEVAWSWLVQPSTWSSLSMISDVIHVITLIIWRSSLLSPPTITLTPETAESLIGALDSLEAVQSRVSHRVHY